MAIPKTIYSTGIIITVNELEAFLCAVITIQQVMDLTVVRYPTNVPNFGTDYITIYVQTDSLQCIYQLGRSTAFYMRNPNLIKGVFNHIKNIV